MNKNLRIRVVRSCVGSYWWTALCLGENEIARVGGPYYRTTAYRTTAARQAKRIAEQTGIKYTKEILRMKDC